MEDPVGYDPTLTALKRHPLNHSATDPILSYYKLNLVSRMGNDPIFPP